jgi:hypothetical protein
MDQSSANNLSRVNDSVLLKVYVLAICSIETFLVVSFLKQLSSN